VTSAEGSVLVTGALGCIGSWTVRLLLEAGIPVVALDPSPDTRRLRLLTSPELMEGVQLVTADITDLAAVEGSMIDHDVDRIIHLAALQLPFSRADPPRGALVNVVGTVNLFEAARRLGITKLVYTSSIAVFDQPGGRVETHAVPRPISHYGVYKLANEGTARAYWHDFGVPSIGIRPMTVYGPGRDRGLTSSPTRAMLAAVLGCRYQVGFGGSTLFHYAADVARALMTAVETPVDGARVFNLNGVHVTIPELVSVLGEILGPSSEGVFPGENPIPFPDDVDTSGLELLGPLPVTPLREGIDETVRFFADLHARGALVPEDHGLVIEGGVAIDRESVASRA
jgi:UDP-glucuronate 4-epimerase